MNQLISLYPINIANNKTKLAEFEEKTNIKIMSKDLVEILLTYEGAKCKKPYYKKGKLEFNLDYFFGFTQNDQENFTINYFDYEDRIPPHFLPIACVDGSDLLCMNNETEEIYYWFHEQDDWGLENNYKYPTKIADNLSQYINSLKPIQEGLPTEQELERAKKEGKTLYTSDDFDDLFSDYLIK